MYNRTIPNNIGINKLNFKSWVIMSIELSQEQLTIYSKQYNLIVLNYSEMKTRLGYGDTFLKLSPAGCKGYVFFKGETELALKINSDYETFAIIDTDSPMGKWLTSWGVYGKNIFAKI